MKHLKTILVVMLIQVPIIASEADELMIRANQLYQEDNISV